MILVLSRDSVKCRMLRTLFSCLIVDHWPDFLDLDSDGLLEAPIPGLAFADWPSMIEPYSYLPLSSKSINLCPTLDDGLILSVKTSLVLLESGFSLTTSLDWPNLSWQVTQGIRIMSWNYNDKRI